MANAFNITTDEFIDKYTDHDDGATYKLARQFKRKPDALLGMACIFLDSDTRRCTIHLERPSVCRSYPHTFANNVNKDRCAYYDVFVMSAKEQGDDRVPLIEIEKFKEKKKKK